MLENDHASNHTSNHASSADDVYHVTLAKTYPTLLEEAHLYLQLALTISFEALSTLINSVGLSLSLTQNHSVMVLIR